MSGDLYHVLAGERHIGMTILEYGHKMNDLHVADANRQAVADEHESLAAAHAR